MARTQTFENAETGLSIRTKLNSIANYNSAYSYNIDDLTHFDGAIYFSLVDNNIGNQPDLSPSQWNTSFSGSNANSASWADNTISASYALTASYSVNGGGSGTTLSTGSTYPITASWAENAINGGTTLQTGSTYPITASWSENALSTSFSTSSAFSETSDYTLLAESAVSSSYAQTSSHAITASYLLGSITSASYAPVEAAFSASVSTLFGTKQNNLSTGSTLPVTASVSLVATTASYALTGGTTLATGSTYPITSSVAVTASYWNSSSVAVILNNKQNNIATGSTLPVTASVSISSSYALTASYAVNAGSGGTTLVTGSTYPITASWASNATSASYAPSAPSDTAISASWASSSLSSSYAVTASSVNVTSTADNATHYLTYVVGAGHEPMEANASLTYNPAAGSFTAPSINTSLMTMDVNNGSAPYYAQLIIRPLSADSDVAVALESTRNSTTQRWFFGSGTGAVPNTNNFRIVDLSANAADRLNIQSGSGYVGIGTTNPSASLHVVGNVLATSYTGSLQGTSSWAESASYASTSSLTLNGSVAYKIYDNSYRVFTGSYTISNEDDGKISIVNSGSIVTVTITGSVSNTFNNTLYQSGSGQIIFITSSNDVILRNRQLSTGSAGQYAVVTLMRLPNNDFLLGGDVG